MVKGRTPKTQAWDACSKYCRIRDCLETTDIAFIGICITCNRRFHISALEAGHFISGRSLSVLFDAECIHAQCTYCNRMQHGQREIYEKVMVARKGQEWVDNRKIRAKRAVRDRVDFKKMEDGFKKRYSVLMCKHGFKTWGELLQQGR